MQPNTPPKPSYATVVASPASKRSASPTKEMYRPVIRIPALGRIIQGKMKANTSASAEKSLKENKGDTTSAATASNAETSDVLPQVNNSTDTQTEVLEATMNEQTPITGKPDKSQSKKAKKARQAAARAAAKEAITAEAATLNEVAENPIRADTEHDILLSTSTTPRAQSMSPAPSTGPPTSPTPRLTAAEKGKGKAHPLSGKLYTTRTPDYTSEEPSTNNNPYKQKASESPNEPKILKRNTATANPPLQTPRRLSHMTTQETEEQRVDLAPSFPSQMPIPQQTEPHEHTTLPQTTATAQNTPPLETERIINHPPQSTLDIFASLPPADIIEKAIESHIRLKPAFCGTETEFNEQTMRLQELLAYITTANIPGSSTTQARHPGRFRSPPPLPEQNPSKPGRTRLYSPPTPTPNMRTRPTSTTSRPSYAQTNPDLFNRQERQAQNVAHTPTRSESLRHLPSVSPMSESEDGISMIDSDSGLGRNASLPPSDVWEEEYGPPPYAHSHNGMPPHHPQHDDDQSQPRNQSPISSPPVTTIIYDADDDMQVDVDPRGNWQLDESPGVIVNGVGLKIVVRPPNGWYRPEYRSGPTQDLTKASLDEVEQKRRHAVWALLYKANYSPLTEQRIADAIRRNVGNFIEVEDAQRIGVTFLEHDSDAPRESRLAKPWHALLSNLSPENIRCLIYQYAFISKELVCWFMPIQEHKSHFAGMIVGFHHQKEDAEEVLDIIKDELFHNKHAELARFVNTKSNPPDADAYHTLIANLRIDFTLIKYKTEDKMRTWSVILPPNNLNNVDTFGFITMLSKENFRTDGAGTGIFIKSHEHPLCDGCKGLGHYFKSCPYHDLQGWPLPKPTNASTDAPQDQPRSWADVQDREREAARNRGRGNTSNPNPRSGGPNRGNPRGRGRARGGNPRGSRNNYYV